MESNNISAIPRTEMGKAALLYRKSKYRFHENCNEVYEVLSLEEITPELLMELIRKHHEEQAPRLNELDDYYEVKNPTIYNRKDRESHLADVRLAHGFARYISSFIQGYLVGNPIKVKHQDPKVNEAITLLNKMFKADRLNSDLTLDLSIYGRAYDMTFRNSKDQDRVVKLDPLKTFVIYGDTVERLPLAGIRYKLNREEQYEIEMYTDRAVIYYVQAGDKLIEVKRQAHYFGEVPITEYSNNRFRQGDFEPVLDQIDAYDAAESDTSNYMTDLNNAMLVIIGNLKLDLTSASQMKEKNTMLLIPATDLEGQPIGNVDAKYIYKQYDVAGVEAYKSRLQNDIHRFTNTPDITDEKFSGSSSGESMKYKLFGLDQVRADKETRMIEGLSRRYRLLFNLKSTAQELTGVDANDLEFVFTPNIPRAFYEELKAFSEAGGQLSQETLLTLTALVADPLAELEKLKEEKEEANKGFEEDPFDLGASHGHSDPEE